jgi:hypothetical protein
MEIERSGGEGQESIVMCVCVCVGLYVKRWRDSSSRSAAGHSGAVATTDDDDGSRRIVEGNWWCSPSSGTVRASKDDHGQVDRCTGRLRRRTLIDRARSWPADRATIGRHANGVRYCDTRGAIRAVIVPLLLIMIMMMVVMLMLIVMIKVVVTDTIKPPFRRAFTRIRYRIEPDATCADCPSTRYLQIGSAITLPGRHDHCDTTTVSSIDCAINRKQNGRQMSNIPQVGVELAHTFDSDLKRK